MSLRPNVSWLSEPKKVRIDAAVRRLLSDIGMRIYHEEALALLETAGCRPGKDRMVRIPADLLDQALSSAPSNIAVFDRSGEPAMDLGGDRSYFGTGSDLLYVLEGDDFTRRRCALSDVARAARVCRTSILSCPTPIRPTSLPPTRICSASRRWPNIPPSRSFARPRDERTWSRCGTSPV